MMKNCATIVMKEGTYDSSNDDRNVNHQNIDDDDSKDMNQDTAKS